MATTRLVTFGFHKRNPKTIGANRVYDVRDLKFHPDHWNDRAKEIAAKVRKGETVAIGCHDGEDRSVNVADRVKEMLEEDGHDVEQVNLDASNHRKD